MLLRPTGLTYSKFIMVYAAFLGFSPPTLLIHKAHQFSSLTALDLQKFLLEVFVFVLLYVLHSPEHHPTLLAAVRTHCFQIWKHSFEVQNTFIPVLGLPCSSLAWLVIFISRCSGFLRGEPFPLCFFVKLHIIVIIVVLFNNGRMHWRLIRHVSMTAVILIMIAVAECMVTVTVIIVIWMLIYRCINHILLGIFCLVNGFERRELPFNLFVGHV